MQLRRSLPAGTMAVLALLVAAVSAAAEDDLNRAAKRIEAGDYESAVVYLKRCAEESDERCQFLLGMMRLSGRGVERDWAIAGVLLRRAALAGLPIAQSNLGVLYANGEGFDKDVEAAAEWYRKAAEFGDPLGQAALGVASYLGQGVPKSTQDAYVWTSLAATQGNEKGLSILSIMRRELTEAELESAQSRIATFRAKENPVANRFANLLAREDLRRAGIERRAGVKTKK